ARLPLHQPIAPASWWPEADLPRTNTMKVRRNLLPIPQPDAGVHVEAASATDDPVGQAIAGAARVSSVRPDQTLAELGLDSMGVVELAIALEEKTGRSLSEGDLRADMTVDQVRTLLLTAAGTP